MTAKLDFGQLDGIGYYLVLNNLDMFEDEFKDGIRRGMSKKDMIGMITGTFQAAAEMDLNYGFDIVANEGSMESYAYMAELGYELYVNGDKAARDARALVSANYDAFKPKGSNASKPRSSKGVKPRASGQAGSGQPRRKNGQFAKRSSASKNTKGVRK